MRNIKGSTVHNSILYEDLSVVVEVSKLSLPADEVVGIAHGEPELKAENCKL